MTADTSVIVAGLSAWHEEHEAAAAALAEVDAAPAHALLESYSVLTRLPGGLAVAPDDAARVLAAAFRSEPLNLSAGVRRELLDALAEVGVRGGASYDALVGLEARAHGETLVTLDRRALDTYRRLDVPVRLLAA